MRAASARLKGFQLTVKGYEFPNLTAQDFSYDANWLIVSAEIRSDLSDMRLKDEACLLTWELAEFARQLEIFSTPQQHGRWQADLKPLEPFVKLRVQQGDSGIYFQARLRSVTRSVTNELEESLKVRWSVTSEELTDFCRQLREMTQLFPEKVEKKESL